MALNNDDGRVANLLVRNLLLSDDDTSESEDEEEVLRENVYKMQKNKFELFKAQDQETGHFDVKFVIDGKLLYAHKFDLSSASETFNAWLSDRWTTNNDPIKIETYSFDIFYQLCCFLYSGGCNLTTKNIFQIIDAAEFFGIQLLKTFCETYIMKRRDKFVNYENALEMMEFVDRYSLSKEFVKYVDDRIVAWHMDSLLDDEKFLTIKKSHLLRLLETRKYDYIPPYDLFVALLKWTEHQANLKKEDDENFDLEEFVKNEFSEFLPYINFECMYVEAFMELIAEKPFLLSPADLVDMFPKCFKEDIEKLFKGVYQLAETQAMKKQKSSIEKDNFDLYKTIKDDMASIIPVTKFSDMSIDFVVDFLVERSFLFSCNELLKILVESKRDNGEQEEKVFKAMYEIAEKEVLQTQEKEPVANFNLPEAIKTELAEFLPLIDFCLIDKKFLMKFVAKGILTHEQALRYKLIKVEIENENNFLIGIFEDNLKILDTVGKNKIQVNSWKEMKQRFTQYKFLRPSEPSELKKKDGIEWYLCLEGGRILTAKHQSIITETDYLIAELKASNENFRFKKNSDAYLKISGC